MRFSEPRGCPSCSGPPGPPARIVMPTSLRLTALALLATLGAAGCASTQASQPSFAPGAEPTWIQPSASLQRQLEAQAARLTYAHGLEEKYEHFRQFLQDMGITTVADTTPELQVPKENLVHRDPHRVNQLHWFQSYYSPRHGNVNVVEYVMQPPLDVAR